MSQSELLAKTPTELKRKLLKILPQMSDNNFSLNSLEELDTLTESEFDLFIKLIEEASRGSTDTYSQILMEDYEEIPVDIETFICDPDYLGRVTDNGRLVYPYWMNHMKETMRKGSPIVEEIYSGAIGIGKSTIAVYGLAYVLYQLLCLKDPSAYYNLTAGSKIGVAIFNMDLGHSYGIGYGKLQSTLKLSPWFLRHGTLSGRTAGTIMRKLERGEQPTVEELEPLTYYPSKNTYIIVGSTASHFTGYDIFCLDGSTEILTTSGYHKIKDLAGSSANLYSQADDGSLIVVPSVDIVETKTTNELYEIELEDGTVIKCTAEHRFKLTDDSYKMACDLTEDDDIMEVFL